MPDWTLTNLPAILPILVIGGLIGMLLFVHFVPLNLWLMAYFSGVDIRLIDLVMMKLRNVPPRLIVDAMITSTKAGLNIRTEEIETHYLAGGHVGSVIRALISAEKASIPLSFKQAAAIDLAGRDVYEAVQISVTPKVINTPAVSAVGPDGIELITEAQVTVRVDLQKLVGGAGEETILARVGEGIVTAIGSAGSYKEVLKNPNGISELVLNEGLDEQTAFKILSIDIRDINVGKNIGAHLQKEQAEANVSQAKAEAAKRQAMARAEQEEMKAKAEKAKAAEIEARAEIPRAIAAALHSGNLGVVDYAKIENLWADTSMRGSVDKLRGVLEKFLAGKGGGSSSEDK